MIRACQKWNQNTSEYWTFKTQKQPGRLWTDERTNEVLCCLGLHLLASSLHIYWHPWLKLNCYLIGSVHIPYKFLNSVRNVCPQFSGRHNCAVLQQCCGALRVFLKQLGFPEIMLPFHRSLLKQRTTKMLLIRTSCMKSLHNVTFFLPDELHSDQTNLSFAQCNYC